jgi:hypothetical protein
LCSLPLSKVIIIGRIPGDAGNQRLLCGAL